VKDMLILGYTTRSHLLLDLDETSLPDVTVLAKHIMDNWPEVGDCLVVESSTPSKTSYLKYDGQGIPHERLVYQNFHLVFDCPIGYNRCLEIIDTLVALDILNSEYKDIRMFRGDMTLRLTPKVLSHRTIPAPKPITIIENQKHCFTYGFINKYLSMLKICRQLDIRGDSHDEANKALHSAVCR
jgi:hypothetical protein